MHAAQRALHLESSGPLLYLHWEEKGYVCLEYIAIKQTSLKKMLGNKHIQVNKIVKFLHCSEKNKSTRNVNNSLSPILFSAIYMA
jgi:hypothetical protein